MAKEIEISRCSDEEKMSQINRLNKFKERNSTKSAEALQRLKAVALNNENIFEELLSTVNYASLGQITNLLYEVGGKYRRNM
jgi:methylmalonyl-CoA mutase